MSSNAISAFGTILKISDVAADGVSQTGSWTEIGEITNVDGPTMDAEVADVTSHDQKFGGVSSAFRAKIATVIDGGDVTLDVNFIPGTHDSASDNLGAALTGRIKKICQIQWPNRPGITTPLKAWEFLALVTNFSVGAPIDDKLSASVTLTVTENIDFDETAA